MEIKTTRTANQSQQHWESARGAQTPVTTIVSTNRALVKDASAPGIRMQGLTTQALNWTPFQDASALGLQT